MENPIIPNHNSEPRKDRGKAFIRFFFEIAQVLVLFFVVDLVIGRERVNHTSMVPTLLPGEILFVNKLEYKFGNIERGDIVIFHYPLNPKLNYVKRIIGLPGDRVVVKDKQVWVNNKKLYEPYISAPPEYVGVWEVPTGNLFVLGDNRNPSADSHVWGFVPLENVIGKAFAVYWPVNNIRGLPTPDIFSSAN